MPRPSAALGRSLEPGTLRPAFVSGVGRVVRGRSGAVHAPVSLVFRAEGHAPVCAQKRSGVSTRPRGRSMQGDCRARSAGEKGPLLTLLYVGLRSMQKCPEFGATDWTELPS